MKFSFEHYAAGENLYTRIVAPLCEKYDLTYMEFTVIMFLANNPMHDTASEIVRRRRLTKSHVSISVRSLQERGLLTGGFQGQNRRTVHLKLTPAADPIVSEGRTLQEYFSNVIFAGFSTEEIKILQAYMERIDQNIEQCASQLSSKQERKNYGQQ